MFRKEARGQFDTLDFEFLFDGGACRVPYLLYPPHPILIIRTRRVRPQTIQITSHNTVLRMLPRFVPDERLIISKPNAIEDASLRHHHHHRSHRVI